MKQMKLSDFITETITEIIAGVFNAQENAKEKNAIVNPAHLVFDGNVYTKVGSAQTYGEIVTPINFEISLTVSETDKEQGGFGIFAAAFGAGVKGENEDRKENIHKIKFQTIIQLPSQK